MTASSWYDWPGMERSLALWMRILGVLLVVLGLVMLIAPDVTVQWRERVLHTSSVDVTAKRERVVVVPRVLATMLVVAGVVVVVRARKRA